MRYSCLLQEKNGRMGKFVFSLVCVMMMVACQKDVDIFIPYTEQVVTGDINRLAAKLKQDLAGEIRYTVSCPCFGNRAFEIDEDVVLVVPPDFVNLGVFPCVNGSFDIEVTVCDTKGEILIAGIPTVTATEILESRIELNLQIRSGTHPVALAHGKQLRILVKDPDPIDRMELFYGEGNQWVEADQNPNTWSNVENSEWWIQQDSSDIISGFGYECFSDSTDWINVDVFYNIPEDQRTSVCVELPEGFTNTNTHVFLLFRDYTSVVPMQGDADLQQFCEPYGKTPIGFRVKFVVVSELGENNYFFATQDAEVTENMQVSLTPLKTPYSEILSYLKQL